MYYPVELIVIKRVLKCGRGRRRVRVVSSKKYLKRLCYF